MDLCDDQDCKKAVKDILTKLSKIDGLVNNAGINDTVGISAGPNEFRKSLDRNLVHYYTMTNLCIVELIKTKGSIVNVSSKVVLTGQSEPQLMQLRRRYLGFNREWAAEHSDS